MLKAHSLFLHYFLGTLFEYFDTSQLVILGCEYWILTNYVEVDSSVQTLSLVLDEQRHFDVFVLIESM